MKLQITEQLHQQYYLPSPDENVVHGRTKDGRRFYFGVGDVLWDLLEWKPYLPNPGRVKANTRRRPDTFVYWPERQVINLFEFKLQEVGGSNDEKLNGELLKDHKDYASYNSNTMIITMDYVVSKHFLSGALDNRIKRMKDEQDIDVLEMFPANYFVTYHK